MLFCEPLFLFAFLPISLLIYYATPSAWKNIVLLGISCVFYAAGESHFVAWLGASVVLNYLVARGLQVCQKRYRKRLLFAGVTSDLALLFVFKYCDFFLANLNEIAVSLHIPTLRLPHFALPLGISFFTFHKISYKIDVYRNPQVSGRSFSELCLYIMLFPQLLAGPIIRYNEIVSQLRARRHHPRDILMGLRRFTFGLAKKLFIANAMGLCADQIFGVSDQIDGVPLSQLSMSVAWLGALTYSLQIYFDFSGYSDMAIGLGNMLGFTFPENFNYPYIATSITDFWRRWHMSLSRWFRDYLYIPLGGNRVGVVRLYANLMTVFLLCGLWHGASWNFVFWGLWHGLLLVLERVTTISLHPAIKKPLSHIYTALAILIGWVFFRADRIGGALNYLKVMFLPATSEGAQVHYQSASWWLDRYCIAALVAGLIGSTPWWKPMLAYARQREIGSHGWGATAAFASQVSACAALFIFSVMIISAGAYSPFIYFRF